MSYEAAATLVDLLDRGRTHSPAITVPEGPTLTYADLRKQVYGLTGQLDSIGLGKGDRVAIALPNRLETIASFPSGLINRHRSSIESSLQRRRVPLLHGGHRSPRPDNPG